MEDRKRAFLEEREYLELSLLEAKVNLTKAETRSAYSSARKNDIQSVGRTLGVATAGYLAFVQGVDPTTLIKVSEFVTQFLEVAKNFGMEHQNPR